ncbi:WhiB family transcriptional regulator [Streptomyces sp. Ru73]|uniref:WhiB family transcriptional regulator n=1 Tax=Streptomyces TaxID=1883 RepID=UPI0004C968F0|nr:WhiB family transcriptional regulator [Streptomyces sp. Ru73]POX43382.1 WhiB family transcriptional regulator [Streptomyces sp. Ru73]
MHHSQPAEPRTLGDYTWHDHAACLSTPANPVDPEIFFPEPDEMDRIRAAKALCEQCPVRQTCLDAALEDGDREGIRGGMTEEERDLLHRNLPHRLDYARVNATLAGRDIHLTDAERRAVTRAAYQAGIPAERLAWLLKVTEEHAEKLYRQVRREIRNRSVNRKNKADLSLATAQADHDDLGAAA